MSSLAHRIVDLEAHSAIRVSPSGHRGSLNLLPTGEAYLVLRIRLSALAARYAGPLRKGRRVLSTDGAARIRAGSQAVARLPRPRLVALCLSIRRGYARIALFEWGDKLQRVGAGKCFVTGSNLIVTGVAGFSKQRLKVVRLKWFGMPTNDWCAPL